jgi:hypothetical protein
MFNIYLLKQQIIETKQQTDWNNASSMIVWAVFWLEELEQQQVFSFDLK